MKLMKIMNNSLTNYGYTSYPLPVKYICLCLIIWQLWDYDSIKKGKDCITFEVSNIYYLDLFWWSVVGSDQVNTRILTATPSLKKNCGTDIAHVAIVIITEAQVLIKYITIIQNLTPLQGYLMKTNYVKRKYYAWRGRGRREGETQRKTKHITGSSKKVKVLNKAKD